MPWPTNKQLIGCKWIYTVKHTPEGRIDHYKGRLVAKIHTQTYGVDYEKCFAPVTNMNTIQSMLSYAANLDWQIL